MSPLTDWIRDVDDLAEELDDSATAENVEDSEAASPDPVPPRDRSRRRRWVWLLIAGICVLGFGLTGWATLRPAATKPSGAAKSQFVTYTDPSKHYRISYPPSWQKTTDTQRDLDLHISGRDAVSVSEFTLAADVNTTNVADMRAVTDAILSTPSAHLTVLASQVVQVGKLTGLYYLYDFPSGAEQGVHAHYFLFSGKQMYTLVFQALPATDFQSLASTFDAVVETFTVTPSQ